MYAKIAEGSQQIFRGSAQRSQGEYLRLKYQVIQWLGIGSFEQMLRLVLLRLVIIAAWYQIASPIMANSRGFHLHDAIDTIPGNFRF